MALNCPHVGPFGFQDYGDDNCALMSDNLVHSSSPVLNFNREDECDLWIDSMDRNYCRTNNPSESSFDMTKVHISSTSRAIGENGRYSFSYPMTSHIDHVQESLKQHRLLQKRRYEGTEMQMAKKQCGMHRKSRGKTNSPSKDPQNHTAKNRRERISERLKVLQEIVPNGTKVDLVTMLEKAISYVQFLQLQVKVLATDEFWPEQGGKALDISQVMQALDAILSSQKEKNS